MHAIETHDLTKRFGSRTAVTDLDLAVPEGAAYGFLGPNGAGKSTTIAMLLDLVRPDAGTARVLGHDVRADPLAVRESVGVVPERFGLFPRLTAREHLRFVIEHRQSDATPASLLDRVGLADAADRRTRGFSTGMAQRLRLAMALAAEPPVLILDEPGAGLDPGGIDRLNDIIADVHARGTTIFCSSHRLDQIAAVCDRVGILVDGRLRASEPIDGPTCAVLRAELRSPDPSLAELAADDPATTGPPVYTGTSGRTLEIGVTAPAAGAGLAELLREHVAVAGVSTERVPLADRYRAVVEGDRCA